ncbi:hypothetical protein [Rufibacter roseus]|uniref:Phage tail protein n=1 Tax=Rufibacter roseus TaxID=1567108 RepID=A0ABW2DSF6_9BACT|nr:hypothetical protein [Rufibacter roseus]
MRDFIGIKLGEEWLDLPPDLVIQIEMWNALFETDRIPGTLILPIMLPHSATNSKKLGFPGHLSVARYKQPQEPCYVFLMGQLWRVGKLNLIKRTPRGYEVNFQTDVGDISVQMKETSLREIDLGTDALQLQVSGVFPDSKYALFTVFNQNFFNGQNVAFNGLVNNYTDSFLAGADNPITPFPFLLHVLHRTMAAFGYTVKGSWLEEEEVKRLVVYNTYALHPAVNGSLITFSNHVPDMKVNEFLKAIRTMFCLGMVFNPLRRELEIVRLSDVVADRSYVEWTHNTNRLYDWEPSPERGFKLEMSPDGNDELQKTATGLTFLVGAGQEPITAPVSTLPMEVAYGRLLPTAFQKGGNIGGSGEEGKFSLRLLTYRGLQPLEVGDDLYPMGTSGVVDVRGSQIGTDSIEWQGAAGLYERRHKPWLTFLSDGDRIETEQTFKVADILGLDLKKRAFIRHESGVFTGLWEKVSISVSKQKGLQSAKVPIRRIY